MVRRSAVRTIPALVLAGACAVMFSGCGDSLTMSEPPDLTEEETLNEFIDSDEIFDDVGIYDSGQIEIGGSDREAIEPLIFWREVTDRTCVREMVVDAELGTADAAIEREVWGSLHIVSKDSMEYEKPFHHSGVRYASFIRDEDWEAPNGPPDDAGNGSRRRHRHGPWELVGLSGFVAASDTCTVSIDWMRVQGADVDTTITDPLALIPVPGGIPTFDVGDEITVSVAGPSEDDVVVLHTRHLRARLVFDGSAFTGSWTVLHPGPHTVWVEAIAHGTLYDSEHPDDTLVWGLPYDVAGEIIE